MKSLILGSFLLTLSLCSLFSQSSLEQQIDEIFEDWNSLDQPGCVVGVFQDGKTLYEKSFGLANMEYDIPVHLETCFQIGSISKQFTAASIILLSLDKRLSLEDKLLQYFPEFPSYAAEISLKHLLYHTSGIRDYDQLIQYSSDGDVDCFYEEDMLTLLKRQNQANFSPGTEFMYSNSGYWLLGKIVEKVSGKTLNQFTKERIFQPLEMENTFFLDDYTQIVKNRAMGYFEEEEMPYGFGWYNTTWDLAGDGGLFTTIKDFKKWEDEFFTKEVLGSTFWAMMLEKGTLNTGQELSYAGGLEYKKYNGVERLEHNGTGFGYSGKFVKIPEEKLTIAVFTNLDGAYFIEHQINAVLDLFLKQEQEDDKSMLPQPKSDWNISDWGKLCASYWQAERLYSRRIFIENDTLWYGRNENSAYPLIPISDHYFVTGKGFSVKFEEMSKGNYQMILIQDGGAIRKLNPYKPISYNETELTGFTGLYFSEELNTQYEIKLVNGQLKWLVEGDEVSSLSPIMENMFRSGGGTNFTFVRNKEGDIQSFKLANLRLRNVVFTKE